MSKRTNSNSSSAADNAEPMTKKVHVEHTHDESGGCCNGHGDESDVEEIQIDFGDHEYSPVEIYHMAISEMEQGNEVVARKLLEISVEKFEAEEKNVADKDDATARINAFFWGMALYKLGSAVQVISLLENAIKKLEEALKFPAPSSDTVGAVATAAAQDDESVPQTPHQMKLAIHAALLRLLLDVSRISIETTDVEKEEEDVVDKVVETAHSRIAPAEAHLDILLKDMENENSRAGLKVDFAEGINGIGSAVAKICHGVPSDACEALFVQCDELMTKAATVEEVRTHALFSWSIVLGDRAESIACIPKRLALLKDAQTKSLEALTNANECEAYVTSAQSLLDFIVIAEESAVGDDEEGEETWSEEKTVATIKPVVEKLMESAMNSFKKALDLEPDNEVVKEAYQALLDSFTPDDN